MIIEFLHLEFEAWRQTLPESADPELEEFPHPNSGTRSARVGVKGHPPPGPPGTRIPVREAELLMWDTGEADLMAVNFVTGEIEVNEYAEVTSRFGIRGLLQDLARAVGHVA
jgi:hypothetical protein